ncbi:MAG TPA: hypothetical protein PLB90_11020, partial [Opitutaceae bacterium]|nr:hypothetical protein [Opitutaceae bacterium]
SREGPSWPYSVIAARAPGNVQLDWAAARGLPDPNYGQNFHAYDGLEDSYWLYRTEVPSLPATPGTRVFLRGESVDFRCEVRVGQREPQVFQGLESGLEVEVTGVPAGTPVEILLWPAPKRHAEPANQTQASHVTKPAVSYGWDWHPRLIPLGLCGDTYFEVRPAVHLRAVDFSYRLAEDFSTADLRVTVDSNPAGAGYRWRLKRPSGQVVLESRQAAARLDRPELWWTHDHGAPRLYTLEVELDGGDRLVRRVGIRRVRLVMPAGGWEDDLSFPKSRNNPPTTLELNGRPIFAKGSNWVPPDIFTGRIDAETYRPLLRLARDAHFNLLRCWGGAGAPKEAFFTQCDELGLLVWQEFPLACNLYPDNPEYLADLDRESRALIRRVRQHPSLAFWVGGNELFNSWSRMTDQSLPLRLLNRNCYDLDPTSSFMPTAPLDGMGHGDYRFRAGEREIFQTFQQARCTAYSEFGCPGASPADYLRTFLPPGELWPPRPGTSWEAHHAFGAWPAQMDSWLCPSTLEHYFGPSASLEELTARSAWLQGEGYKSVFEEARRQRPRCAMALNWCFNEPWPTAANNSIVNWPAQPKPAYDAVRAACRPTLASARIPRFQWRPGERFRAELWFLNDTSAGITVGTVTATLAIGARVLPLGEWRAGEVAALSSLAGPAFAVDLPAGTETEFVLRLAVEPHPEWSSDYRLSLRPA